MRSEYIQTCYLLGLGFLFASAEHHDDMALFGRAGGGCGRRLFRQQRFHDPRKEFVLFHARFLSEKITSRFERASFDFGGSALAAAAAAILGVLTWNNGHEQAECSSISSSTAHRYDFVVIGHGTAGQQAVQTLQELAVTARWQPRIAVLDPLLASSRSRSACPDYWPGRAVALDPAKRTVTGLITHDNQFEEASLSYRHAVLIATGSHGAPIPHQVLDPAVRELDPPRLLEVRPTTAAAPGFKWPVLARPGNRVGILGSGWEALDLAWTAAAVPDQQVWLVFGSAAPLSPTLPRYLSLAVAQRWRRAMHVLDRTLVRYMSWHDDGLQLYTAQAHDLLDTDVLAPLDVVVVAPDTHSSPLRGNARQPLPVRTAASLSDQTQEHRTWYQSWSDLVVDSSLACYLVDGRIVPSVATSGPGGRYQHDAVGHVK
jgi:hypothetical protein